MQRIKVQNVKRILRRRLRLSARGLQALLVFFIVQIVGVVGVANLVGFLEARSACSAFGLLDYITLEKE